MTQDHNSLDEKRQKALQRLRGNRGKERINDENWQKTKGDPSAILLKEYRDGYRQQKTQLQESEEEEIADTVLAPEQLPRLLKASGKVKEREDRSTGAVEQIKEIKEQVRQHLKDAKQARKAALDQPPTAENPPVFPAGELMKRQQLREDLLSADFFQGASKWLGNIRADPHLTTTPIEEVEFLYQQAKYRYKVLKLLMEDTQAELDGFEAYLRMVPNPPQ